MILLTSVALLHNNLLVAVLLVALHMHHGSLAMQTQLHPLHLKV